MSGMPELPRGTVTFLFSDIEGSTSLLRALGQEVYGEALAEYQRLLRDACTERGGHEVDTQGDAIFFAFAHAKDAVDAAAAVQRALAVHAWPDGTQLHARIGLHTGQASIADSRYVGLSVHRAARVCAAGAGGQVLLSQATAGVLEDDDLGDLRLRTLGRHALKDFDRPVVLHQLDVPGLPSKFARPKTKPKALPRSRLLLAGGAAALLLVTGAAVALVARGDGRITIGPTSVGVIDPSTDRVVDEIPLGTEASLIAAGEGFVWLADPDTSTLFKIDPETRAIVRRTGIGAEGVPTGIAVGEGSVWLAVNRGRTLVVLELGPELANLRRQVVIGRSLRSLSASESAVLTVGEGAVWALEVGQGEVSRIDPGTGHVSVRAGGVDAHSIAVGQGALWLGGNNSVTRMDPGTGAILASIPVGGGPSASTAIAVGAGAVWFAGSSEPKVLRIGTQTNAITDSFTVGAGPASVAVGEGAVWVANSIDGTISRIDANKTTVATIPLGGAPVSGVVAEYGSVWTSPGQPVR
jgi:class 3 adenylate cyclase/DNA-binding beta-propeller fold protein YncE